MMPLARLEDNMATSQKTRSTKRVLNFLHTEAPTAPMAEEGPPPLPEMEEDEDIDLALLPLTKPRAKSKLFRG